MQIYEMSEPCQLDPLHYPWHPPDTSGVLCDAEFLPLQLVYGRRLGQAHQRDNGQDSFSSCSLNKALIEANAATLDSRFLVVSFGSNSCPEVMARKFADYRYPVSRVLPIVRGKIHNISVGHSAHVSNGGYIAAAPYFKNGARTTVWVSWLDELQLAALDQTEPNYRRVQLHGDAYPLELDNGEHPESFSIYISMWGVLGDGGKLPFTEQSVLFRSLSTSGVAEHREHGRNLFEGDDKTVVRRLRQVSVQIWAREWFSVAGLAQGADFDGLNESTPVSYGEVDSVWRPSDKGALRALATADDVDRQGQQCVEIHPEDAQALGLRENAIVNALVGATSFSSRPGLMVRVVPTSDAVRGTARVDQIVRNALGIERQEYIKVRPALAAPVSRALGLIGDPSYMVCRVQGADLASVEQEISLVEPLAMRFLGITQGDFIIVEGVRLNDKNVVQPVRLRSIELADSISDRRKSLSGGGFEARFPSSADAMGVFPDLPSIFLDASIRHKLGLGNAKLCAVRIRASRRYQLVSQLREALLILVLALIGVVSIVQDPLWVVAAIFVISVVAVLVVFARLRSQLGLRRQRSTTLFMRRGRHRE